MGDSEHCYHHCLTDSHNNMIKEVVLLNIVVIQEQPLNLGV